MLFPSTAPKPRHTAPAQRTIISRKTVLKCTSQAVQLFCCSNFTRSITLAPLTTAFSSQVGLHAAAANKDTIWRDITVVHPSRGRICLWGHGMVGPVVVVTVLSMCSKSRVLCEPQLHRMQW